MSTSLNLDICALTGNPPIRLVPAGRSWSGQNGLRILVDTDGCEEMVSTRQPRRWMEHHDMTHTFTLRVKRFLNHQRTLVLFFGQASDAITRGELEIKIGMPGLMTRLHGMTSSKLHASTKFKKSIPAQWLRPTKIFFG